MTQARQQIAVERLGKVMEEALRLSVLTPVQAASLGALMTRAAAVIQDACRLAEVDAAPYLLALSNCVQLYALREERKQVVEAVHGLLAELQHEIQEGFEFGVPDPKNLPSGAQGASTELGFRRS